MPNRKYKSILIVEDDVAIRETLKEVIEALGYIVFMASNGVEALKKIDVLAETSLPCLILTDLLMPKMDGYEFIQRLQQKHTIVSIPIIVMSAHGKAMPGHRFLRKPFDLEGLIQAVEEMAEKAPDCGEDEK